MSIQLLRERFSAKLSSSVLTAADAKKLRFELCTAQTCPRELPKHLSGFKLPYFTLDGRPTSFYRYRYLEETRRGFEKLTGARPLRYAQPPKSAPEIYLPPLINWRQYLENADARIVFTEGELKAACAVKHGIPTLGLGGVWSWRSAKQQVPLIPGVKTLPLKGRPCIIAFDSDAATNLEVRRAEVYFAEALGALGAVVSIARMPPAPDGAKQGLDDFILAHGAEALVTEVLSVAQPYAATARLHALNAEVTVVQRPGFILRLADRYPMSVTDFTRLHYADWSHVDYSDPQRPRTVSTPEAWLKWPQRAVVSGVTYAPGAPEVLPATGELNLWTGWPRAPVPGSVELWRELLDHVFWGAPTSARTWFEQWAAYPLQHPGAKLRSAAVLWGRHTGTGKSLIGYTLGRLYGEGFAEINDEALDPARAFNSWAKNKQFVMADDITGHNNRRLANKLKVMVSRERIEINEKNLREYSVPDVINYLFTANDPDAFYLDDHDRRFFIHEVISAKAPKEFYARYDAWYRSEPGAAALFDHLLNLSLDGFDPMAEPPVTAAKLEMVALSKTELEAWVAAVAADPDSHLLGLKGDLFTPEELITAYDPSGTRKEVSPILMARKLAIAGVLRVQPTDSPNGQLRSTVRGKLVRLYALRNRDKWRVCLSAEAARHYDLSRADVVRRQKF